VDLISSSVAFFSNLQVLVVTGTLSNVDDTGLVLEQVLPALTQLQQLSLHTYVVEDEGTGDALLRSLPSSLRALDLGIFGSDPCSSSSLEHLVHLTSLKLDRVDVEDDTAGSFTEQQQRQQEQQHQQELLARMYGSAQQEDEQEQVQGPLPPSLKALSMRPLSLDCWFAGPGLEQVELFFNSLPTPSLAQLAGCPRLRQLSVGYYYHVPDVTGVSMLTQLTRLRLQAVKVSLSSSSLASMGADLAALEQLQVLEVSYGYVQAMQPQTWLPRLRCLTRLVALSVNFHLEPLQHLLGPLQHLAAVITEWHASSSSSGANDGSQASCPSTAAADSLPITSSSGGDDNGGGDNSGSTAAVSAEMAGVSLTTISSSEVTGTTLSAGDGTACAPQQLVLTLPSSQPPPPGGRHAAALSELQRAAADIDAAHPWLQVVVSVPGTNTCPCWLSEEEKMCTDAS
jgi:hypothetical protein